MPSSAGHVQDGRSPYADDVLVAEIARAIDSHFQLGDVHVTRAGRSKQLGLRDKKTGKYHFVSTSSPDGAKRLLTECFSSVLAFVRTHVGEPSFMLDRSYTHSESQNERRYAAYTQYALQKLCRGLPQSSATASGDFQPAEDVLGYLLSSLFPSTNIQAALAAIDGKVIQKKADGVYIDPTKMWLLVDWLDARRCLPSTTPLKDRPLAALMQASKCSPEHVPTEAARAYLLKTRMVDTRRKLPDTYSAVFALTSIAHGVPRQQFAVQPPKPSSEHEQLFEAVLSAMFQCDREDSPPYVTNLRSMLVNQNQLDDINKTHKGVFFDSANEWLLVHWIEASHGVLEHHPRYGGEAPPLLRKISELSPCYVKTQDAKAARVLERMVDVMGPGHKYDLITIYDVKHLLEELRRPSGCSNPVRES